MTDFQRTEPPHVADERTMLRAWLDYHRQTLEWKCQGLAFEQLKERAIPPSTISLIGLVRHMTEVELGWFRGCLAGEEPGYVYCTDAEPDADWDNLDSATSEEVFASWHEACGIARQAEEAVPRLDDIGKQLRRNGQPVQLRWIMIHMIEEYARHNGHADFLRERLDGQTGD